ncbi:MAG TPA: PfkB family carbohydrate kinase [Bauldia sp.]|nr:PfkB family carbohydrate kinase [Bauldia sp.]
MRRGILTGGTWCVDRNIMVDVWPQENGRADILDADQSGGGSGFNLAIDVRRLDPDMPVGTIAIVGADAYGDFLKGLADENGVERSHMATTAESDTDYTIAFASKATGRRTHISYFGTSHLLTPDHFDFAGLDHKVFHLGLPGIHRTMDAPWQGDANGWVTTLRKARAAGLVTNMELASIDQTRQAALVRPCLPHLDLLVVNDHEIGGIAGVDTVPGGVTDPEACIRAATAALGMSAAGFVVVHFPHGAVAVGRDGDVVRKPSVRVPPSEAAGANGAGDAFAAGFLYAYHEGWTLDRMLALAHATAAASLREISTIGAIMPWRDCLALADRWGWRETLA